MVERDSAHVASKDWEGLSNILTSFEAQHAGLGGGRGGG
jgi:hypothetical protein